MTEEQSLIAEPSFIAGHPVLDFVNTVAWRMDETRRAERVPDAAAWTRWAADVGLTMTAPPDTTALRSLRDVIGAVLDAFVEDAAPRPAAWDHLRRTALAARERAVLPGAFPLRWVPSTLADELVLSAEELLADTRALTRVSRCAGPGCGWFFLDRSRNGNRRWCSSGDCGNRDRARRHYALKKRSDAELG